MLRLGQTDEYLGRIHKKQVKLPKNKIKVAKQQVHNAYVII